MALRKTPIIGPSLLRPADPLQELYNHLDHCDHGDKYIAWYGQCRAQGMSHKAAIQDTVEHYKLLDTEWYQLRLERMKKK